MDNSGLCGMGTVGCLGGHCFFLDFPCFPCCGAIFLWDFFRRVSNIRSVCVCHKEVAWIRHCVWESVYGKQKSNVIKWDVDVIPLP